MSKRLSPHFRIDEFACPCCGQVDMDPELIETLEKIREELGGRMIRVNSGYRCEIHNKEVGGSPFSLHMRGKAADITVLGYSPAKVQQHLADHIGGLGSYTTFTHIDTRGYRARWKG